MLKKLILFTTIIGGSQLLIQTVVIASSGATAVRGSGPSQATASLARACANMAVAAAMRAQEAAIVARNQKAAMQLELAALEAQAAACDTRAAAVRAENDLSRIDAQRDPQEFARRQQLRVSMAGDTANAVESRLSAMGMRSSLGLPLLDLHGMGRTSYTHGSVMETRALARYAYKAARAADKAVVDARRAR